MRPKTSSGVGVGLCASCDRCRARKTKCDGKRPCGSCKTNYMKKNKLDSVDHIPISLFGCVYSPAKRRGPVPGKSGQVRKAAEVLEETASKRNANLLNLGHMSSEGNKDMLQIASLSTATNVGFGGENLFNPKVKDTAALHRHFLLQQLNLGRAGMQSSRSAVGANINGSSPEQMNFLQQQIQLQQQQLSYEKMMKKMRPKSDKSVKSNPDHFNVVANDLDLPSSVMEHLSLLEKSSIDGNRLRSYYDLSINSLNRLPPVPSDEEYCSRLGGNMNPSMLPRFDLAALRAARFAEIALGALINDQETIALELSNATVTCLGECAGDPVHPSCVFDVARAYYLQGLFRCYRGDLVRYFKYRRVCLTHLSLTDTLQGIDAFLAAISFHDSWAYMMYNANEGALPSIDDIPPPLSNYDTELKTAAEKKYKTSTNPHITVTADKNKMWIQGVPPVFINNEAPPLSRCLDALACAIRSCCDEANNYLNDTNKDNEMAKNDEEPPKSITSLAVAENEKELCCRNMLLSAFTLLRQHETHILNIDTNRGHHLIISALDAFLEGPDSKKPDNIFSDAQIQSLLHVCNTSVEHPYLLYQPGPMYHIISNAAVLLSYVLNGLHSNRDLVDNEQMEAELFNTILETFLSVRKMLNLHRLKISPGLRCHFIPRPGLTKSRTKEAIAPFIDLERANMCLCKGCQTFVLMGCSPMIATDRSQNSSYLPRRERLTEVEMSENDNTEMKVPFESELPDGATETDTGDDDLLNAVSQILSSYDNSQN